MAAAQEEQEKQANKSRKPQEAFKVGDKVWLSLKNIKTERPNKKLDWVNAKFTVTRVVSPHAYELDTPPGIHNVFHVDLLRHIATDSLPLQEVDDSQPLPIINNKGVVEYDVEEILKAKGKGGHQKVYVKWKGYARPSWEPLDILKDNVAVDRFEEKYGDITLNDSPSHARKTR